MEYHISKPSLFLSQFVKQYWAIENCLPKGAEHTQRIIPNGLSELIFYFSDKPESSDNCIRISDQTVVTGQLSKHYDLKVTGNLSMFSIVFHPFALSVFVGFPSSELLNQALPLRYLFKDSINELEDNLIMAKSFNQRINIVETFLQSVLQKQSTNQNYLSRIKHSVQLINQTRGMVSINKLAGEACYGRKQFERAFLETVGISPKQFLKVVRFQNVIHEKSISNQLNMTDLTYKCGYYDQSHMTNDFQKFSGLSPRKFFDECQPYSDYFQ